MPAFDLAAELSAAASRRAIAGASAALIDQGRLTTAVFGARDIDRGDAVDAQTIFPLYSFTKVLAAFLTCQLVAEGKLDLDDKVAGLAPGLDAPVLDGVTLRHLLLHTSGLSDIYEEIDADGLTRRLREISRVTEPGALFSYSNLGYALVGRITEAATGLSWDEALKARLIDPLGLENVLSIPPAARPANAALQHDIDPQTGKLFRGDTLPDVGVALAAAGSTVWATASDAARLAGACISGRDLTRPDAPTLLPAALVGEMVRQQVRLPGQSLFADGWGVGWSVGDGGWDHRGVPHVAHMGGSSVFVRADPATGRVLASLTNCPTGADLGRELGRKLFGGRDAPAASSPAPDDAALERYVGDYGSALIRVQVSRDEQGLWATNPFSGAKTLLHWSGASESGDRWGDSFWADFGQLRTELVFLGEGTERRPTYLHAGLRAVPRIAA